MIDCFDEKLFYNSDWITVEFVPYLKVRNIKESYNHILNKIEFLPEFLSSTLYF